jgi:hypothetical protein
MLVGFLCGFATVVASSVWSWSSIRESPATASAVAVTRETPEEAKLRHQRVSERRNRVHIICHRGALEFAQENTLEAYRATLELGADGNEIDIRRTQDGVLVCFHDDMLDRLVDAYGTIREVGWSELQSIPFRDPGPYGEKCRVPTLVEVLELHRAFAGLLHLDIKEPDLDDAIAQLLDRFDMWDHVAHCNSANAEAIVANPKTQLSRYKAGLYENREEVDAAAIQAALQRPGQGLIVEDPRGVLVALGRPIGSVSRKPVDAQWRRPDRVEQPIPPVNELVAILASADAWDRVPQTRDDQFRSGARIRERARAAENILALNDRSAATFAALEDRVRHRTLHKDWMYHGFDGAMSLRTLILLQAPQAADLARYVLWLDDPLLDAVHDKKWNTPRSWTDFRLKMVVFSALEKLPGVTTEQLCRDYLALTDEAARQIGPLQFEPAARTLLTLNLSTETAIELMHHRRGDVRGRAILDCVERTEEPWARTALERAAPHALQYVIP